MQSDRGVKRSMSEESDDYTYIPPKMDLLSQEQRVKSPWTKLLRKQLALHWEKNIEERRQEFERAGDEYTVANARAVNHFLPQLRKELRIHLRCQLLLQSEIPFHSPLTLACVLVRYLVQNLQ